MIKNYAALEAATNEVVFYHYKENSSQSLLGEIVVERAIEVIINSTKSLILFATPTNLEALITGLLFSLKIIETAEDIRSINIKSGEILTAEILVKDANNEIDIKNTVINSTQGTSSIMYNQNWSKNISPTNFTLRLEHEYLRGIMEKLLQKQQIYNVSRGAHAAGIFNEQGEIISFAEDVGRHNALDKAVGSCLLNKIYLNSHGAVLTSRISYEMVAKAARANLEFIIAISAPTTLAVLMANQWNITLCGLRDRELNIYTHVSRIINKSK